MNKTQLKNFAVAARVALIERVKDRARGFGIDEKTCAGGAVIPASASTFTLSLVNLGLAVASA